MSDRQPPFRAEHVGSLLRPDERDFCTLYTLLKLKTFRKVIQKRYAVAKGEATQADLTPIEDRAVRDIVALQQECGFHGTRVLSDKFMLQTDAQTILKKDSAMASSGVIR